MKKALITLVTFFILFLCSFHTVEAVEYSFRAPEYLRIEGFYQNNLFPLDQVVDNPSLEALKPQFAALSYVPQNIIYHSRLSVELPLCTDARLGYGLTYKKTAFGSAADDLAWMYHEAVAEDGLESREYYEIDLKYQDYTYFGVYVSKLFSLADLDLQVQNSIFCLTDFELCTAQGQGMITPVSSGKKEYELKATYNSRKNSFSGRTVPGWGTSMSWRIQTEIGPGIKTYLQVHNFPGIVFLPEVERENGSLDSTTSSIFSPFHIRWLPDTVSSYWFYLPCELKGIVIYPISKGAWEFIAESFGEFQTYSLGYRYLLSECSSCKLGINPVYEDLVLYYQNRYGEIGVHLGYRDFPEVRAIYASLCL